jgi:hypothetical protein
MARFWFEEDVMWDTIDGNSVELNMEHGAISLEIRREDLVKMLEAMDETQAEMDKQYAEVEREMEEKITVDHLLKDYGLMLGNMIAGTDPDELAAKGDISSPLDYLAEFLDMAFQPPKEECRKFLELFYRNNPIAEEWMNTIVWREDEDEDVVTEEDVQRIIREATKEEHNGEF